MDKIPDSDREKSTYEVLDIIIDKLNEIIEKINSKG